jgi:hypothetical protein
VKFPDDAPVGPEKKAALRERLLRLGVDLAAISEQAVLGDDKTSSGVLLRYELRPVAGPDPERSPELLIVRWTQERQHSLNRFLALRELADQIELRVSPETSARLAEIARLRKQKARQAARHGKRREPGSDSE